MNDRPIVIIGFMGSGKSSVARALGQYFRCSATDLDDEITALEGQTPAQLIENQSEEAFRKIETRVLRDVFRRGARIVALGGGAWITPANHRLISQVRGFSIWLDAPFDACWRRIVAARDNRPLARNREDARALYDLRRSHYELADLRVDVRDELDLRQLVKRIAESLPGDIVRILGGGKPPFPT